MFNNNIILPDIIYISENIWLSKENEAMASHFQDSFNTFGSDEHFTRGEHKENYGSSGQQILTVFNNKSRIISFSFLSGFILYHLDDGYKGFIKIISQEKFEAISHKNSDPHN